MYQRESVGSLDVSSDRPQLRGNFQAGTASGGALAQLGSIIDPATYGRHVARLINVVAFADKKEGGCRNSDFSRTEAIAIPKGSARRLASN